MRGLIGKKLGHSYSKVIHERLKNQPYELIELSEQQFEIFMEQRNFEALNVTIPYKQKVIPYLDEIDPIAKKINAINTIVHRGGRLIGSNTDVSGFSWLLRHHHISLQDKKVIILGNGGAAQAIKEVCHRHQVRELIVAQRTPLEEAIAWSELAKHEDAQVIINCTPVGMFPNSEASPLDLTPYHQLETVLDLIYNPHRTALLVQAEKQGCVAVGGLGMLVAQAVYAFEQFENCKMEDEKIAEIYHQLQREKLNQVFIGMPGSGKTTCSRKLAERTGRPWIDLDEEIERQAQKKISELFEAGEDVFRKWETEVTRQISEKTGMIISCGGGIIKNELNIDRLKRNGVVMMLDRRLEQLEISDHRPLSKNFNQLKKLYQERDSLYRKMADVIIDNTGCLEATLEKIEKVAEE